MGRDNLSTVDPGNPVSFIKDLKDDLKEMHVVDWNIYPQAKNNCTESMFASPAVQLVTRFLYISGGI